MVEQVIQRVVFPAKVRLRPLYFRSAARGSRPPAPPEILGRFSLQVNSGDAVSTDAYFNSFFEAYWRGCTRVQRLRLRVEVEGAGVVRLWRRSPLTGRTLLEDARLKGERRELHFDVPPPTLTAREAGSLHFELWAGKGSLRLHRAEWLAVDAESTPVRLAACYCTFHREEYLLDNLRTLLSEPAAAAVIERLIVVDQGTRKFRNHPGFAALKAVAGSRLHVVEQGNFGGAGGFTRGILEAREIAGATHALLMDDDAIVEPESVARTAAFLGLAREEIAVGAANLDLFRPLEMHEAGGRVEPDRLNFIPYAGHRLALDLPAGVGSFLEVGRPHYNAWWFFAFPLKLIDRVGLPLPVFIRGDDIEFGCRLARAGVASITVPGLGVWHEPGYIKPRHGAWQPYYNLRNSLIVNALHFSVARRRIGRAFLKRVVERLLALDYYEAKLTCDAAMDFCRGPNILQRDPQEIHQRLLADKRAMELQAIQRGDLAWLAPKHPPASRLRRLWFLGKALGRQLIRRSPTVDAPPVGVLPEANADLWSLAKADVVAIDNPHVDKRLVLRRSRKAFLQLLAQALKLTVVLVRDYPRVAQEWRDAAESLTSDAFWRSYLATPTEEERKRAA